MAEDVSWVHHRKSEAHPLLFAALIILPRSERGTHLLPDVRSRDGAVIGRLYLALRWNFQLLRIKLLRRKYGLDICHGRGPEHEEVFRVTGYRTLSVQGTLEMTVIYFRACVVHVADFEQCLSCVSESVTNELSSDKCLSTFHCASTSWKLTGLGMVAPNLYIQPVTKKR